MNINKQTDKPYGILRNRRQITPNLEFDWLFITSSAISLDAVSPGRGDPSVSGRAERASCPKIKLAVICRRSKSYIIIYILGRTSVETNWRMKGKIKVDIYKQTYIQTQTYKQDTNKQTNKNKQTDEQTN